MEVLGKYGSELFLRQSTIVCFPSLEFFLISRKESEWWELTLELDFMDQGLVTLMEKNLSIRNLQLQSYPKFLIGFRFVLHTFPPWRLYLTSLLLQQSDTVNILEIELLGDQKICSNRRMFELLLKVVIKAVVERQNGRKTQETTF